MWALSSAEQSGALPPGGAPSAPDEPDRPTRHSASSYRGLSSASSIPTNTEARHGVGRSGSCGSWGCRKKQTAGLGLSPGRAGEGPWGERWGSLWSSVTRGDPVVLWACFARWAQPKGASGSGNLGRDSGTRTETRVEEERPGADPEAPWWTQ